MPYINMKEVAEEIKNLGVIVVATPKSLSFLASKNSTTDNFGRRIIIAINKKFNNHEGNFITNE